MVEFPQKNKCFTDVIFIQWHWLTLGLALLFLLHWESIAINIWGEGLRGSVVNLFYKHIHMLTHLMTLMKDFHPANSDRCNSRTIISIISGISRPVNFNSIILLFYISTYIVNAILVLWEINIPVDCHCICKSAPHYLIRRRGAGGESWSPPSSQPVIYNRGQTQSKHGEHSLPESVPHTVWAKSEATFHSTLQPALPPTHHQCQHHGSCHQHKRCERTPSCFRFKFMKALKITWVFAYVFWLKKCYMTDNTIDYAPEAIIQ